MSTEWSVTFSVRLSSHELLDGYCNIINFYQNGVGRYDYGGRIPMFGIKKTSTRIDIQIFNSVNGNGLHYYELPLPADGELYVEIHQRYVSGGNYRFFVKMNGQEIYSVINKDARQFYNVEVYASNQWHLACPGYIKNLEFTNFL